MSDKTLDQELYEVISSLSEERKRSVLELLKAQQKKDLEQYPTREQLWALPPEERNRIIEIALKRSEIVLHEDLEGYTEDDFDDGTLEE
jgi:hypothetical protein